MTSFLRRCMRAARDGLLLVALLGVARCTEPPPAPAGPLRPAAAAPAAATPPVGPEAAAPVGPAAAAPVSPAAAAPVVPAAAAPAASPMADGKPVLFNDPPARPDTPLCGRQAQEVNAIGAVLQGPRVAASGICARFACYDPLTASYLGADGYRHVCR